MREGGMGGSSEAVAQPPGASAAAGSRVFLSYASPDAAVANQVCEYLETHGVSCWMAPRDVKPGAAYADAIVRAINEASALVLMLSAAAMASEHVSREVERAASKHKPVVAVPAVQVSIRWWVLRVLQNVWWSLQRSLSYSASAVCWRFGSGSRSTGRGKRRWLRRYPINPLRCCRLRI